MIYEVYHVVETEDGLKIKSTKLIKSNTVDDALDYLVEFRNGHIRPKHDDGNSVLVIEVRRED